MSGLFGYSYQDILGVYVNINTFVAALDFSFHTLIVLPSGQVRVFNVHIQSKLL